MGRKVHPLGFRLGIIKTWKSRWFAEGEDYADLLGEDLAIRELIRMVDLDGPESVLTIDLDEARGKPEQAAQCR